MQVTTTRNRPKAFSWSYSKIKNFETCPKRYFHVDVEKSVKEEESENLMWGNAVHEALARRLDKETELPPTMAEYEKWAQRILETPGQLLVEQKLAITKDFQPTTWFGNDAWFRGIGDVIKIIDRTALIVDWKTGKIIEDGSQLALMAACVFAHHSQVIAVRSEFVWLKEDATTRADFKRDDMAQVWREILPRVSQLEQATQEMNFPPKPGGLCRRYCPVSACPHHGV